MKSILHYLYDHKTLDRSEAKRVLTNIAQGQYNHSQIASFLSVYMMRSITVDELIGFRDALLDLCVPINLSEFNTIDLCGTGGDGKDTFNISTLSSFVVAAAGYKVTKHGNYGVSSGCGSSNIMETLGYKFSADNDKLRKELDKTGVCYLHAPFFNPAMKNVAPVRKDLGVRTFFNMLGPMINPSSPQNQIVGVFSLELARMYTYIYQQGTKNFYIIHGLDGYDEVSLTSDFKLIGNSIEQIISPEDLGMRRIQASEIASDKSVEEAVKLFLTIIEGKGTQAQTDVVAVNSGIAIQCMNPTMPLQDCISLAKEMLVSGKAKSVLSQLLSLQ